MAQQLGIPCCSAPVYLSTTVDSMEILAVESVDENDSIATSNTREREEVTGWRLDAIARGVAIMGSAVFVSTALLKLAKQAAGCETEPQEDGDVVPECHGRIYGMRPSSLLTNIVMVVGFISAVIMPLVGSVIDHSRYRRAVGRLSAGGLGLLIVLQIFMLERAWFFAAILQVLIAFTYMVHLVAVYAYLPELTPNKEALVTYAAQFFAAQYTASVTFLIFMVIILSLVGVGPYQEHISARLSQSVVFIVCTICFGTAWTILFRDRPASQKVPEGSTLLTAGFQKIFKTSRTIISHHTAIKWFLVSAAFTESAATSFSSIAITYMTDQLSFSSTENGIAILLLQIFGVPGTRFAAEITNRFNPIRSLQGCLLAWMINTAAAAYVLHGSGQQMMAYFFAVVWGLCFGWLYPTEKALYCTIIPKGSEAELMGMYICANQIFAWLPPLVFSAMNELGISMRVGLFSLNIYFLLSFCILFLVGDYDKAVAHANDCDDRRFADDTTKEDKDYLILT